ncbi:glycoside hydrolase family 6 protein [Pseudoduganella sp. SL102]|uniref:glycoside hydrolase family 6 protein n=1 Tax=Pseudoduganella sp. SL102 TaxID=2995154 RepID=UPI00248C3721|nr:glycoside hydrolase family 6 protein [Pseudoduganella sp. SL102]WBS01127.1 glycoside hydrolase family 6 protein [Pseudoduganella sp. SL102]
MMHTVFRPALATLVLLASGAASAAPTCAATYATRDDWANGFVVDIVVTNTGSNTVSGWNVTWDYGSAVTLASAPWGARVAVAGGRVTATDDGGRPSIAPGASIGFGMPLAYAGARPVPGKITVGGAHCTIQGPSPNLYSDPQSAAARWVRDNAGDGRAAEIGPRIADQPAAKWFGGWSGDIGNAVGSYVGAAAAARRVPVLVAYNIPARDCGQHSAGGAGSAGAYQDWIRAFANAIGPREAVVVLEPDALPQLDCLDAAGKATRLQLFRHAVAQFNERAPRTALYIDIGNSDWLEPAEAAARLVQAGIASAEGFALNVSNYRTDGESNPYGIAVSQALRQQAGWGKPFVVDTSRNGAGPDGREWCDPPGRKIGVPPRVNAVGSQPAMTLWVKAPGEADGCAAAAGTFLPEMAFKMIHGY